MMASRIGRNPFQPSGSISKQFVAAELEAELAAEPPASKNRAPSFPLEWMLVDLPAEAYVFGLKAFLFVQNYRDF